MSAETGALATTPRPLGKPGGPGLFHDKSLSLPPYIQNVAHSLMTKRGMDKSRAISTALGVAKNWASGRGNVQPEVRAAATAALAQWDAAKAKARATPNKGEVTLSQPMTLLRTILDGSSAVELARPAEDTAPQKPAERKAKKEDGEQRGKHKLPPGAVGWRHNWVPVDENGNPVGPSQKDKTAQQIKDMAGHSDATKDAIRKAYANKARADGEKARKDGERVAKKAKSKAESDARKAKSKAAAAARKKASEKKAAARKALAKQKADAATAKRTATAKTKARQKLVSDATKQALADKKAGRPLTPTQVRLLGAYEKQTADQLDKLRNGVSLSQPMTEATPGATVPTVTSQDGARLTMNSLMTKAPRRRLADATISARKKRRGARRGKVEQ